MANALNFPKELSCNAQELNAAKSKLRKKIEDRFYVPPALRKHSELHQVKNKSCMKEIQSLPHSDPLQTGLAQPVEELSHVVTQHIPQQETLHTSAQLLATNAHTESMKKTKRNLKTCSRKKNVTSGRQESCRKEVQKQEAAHSSLLDQSSSHQDVDSNIMVKHSVKNGNSSYHSNALLLENLQGVDFSPATVQDGRRYSACRTNMGNPSLNESITISTKISPKHKSDFEISKNEKHTYFQCETNKRKNDYSSNKIENSDMKSPYLNSHWTRSEVPSRIENNKGSVLQVNNKSELHQKMEEETNDKIEQIEENSLQLNRNFEIYRAQTQPVSDKIDGNLSAEKTRQYKKKSSFSDAHFPGEDNSTKKNNPNSINDFIQSCKKTNSANEKKVHRHAFTIHTQPKEKPHEQRKIPSTDDIAWDKNISLRKVQTVPPPAANVEVRIPVPPGFESKGIISNRIVTQISDINKLQVRPKNGKYVFIQPTEETTSTNLPATSCFPANKVEDQIDLRVKPATSGSQLNRPPATGVNNLPENNKHSPPTLDYWDMSIVSSDPDTNKISSHLENALAPAESVIREVAGDLFSVSNTASLVHCVAEDLRMSLGIAVEFRQRFGRIPELLNQRCITGQLAFLSDPRDDPKRFIFYLVTKAKSTAKPTLESLESSLHCLKDHCMRQNVTQLAMPRIGCGLDLLKWSQVNEMLHRIFMNSGISITIYNLDLDQEEREDIKYFIFKEVWGYQLSEMESGTGRIFLASEGPMTDGTMQELNMKYRFMSDYKHTKRSKGDVFRYECKFPHEVIYGLVVRGRSIYEPVDYVALDIALRTLQKHIKKDNYVHIGIDAYYEESDPVVVEKLITAMKWVFGKMSVQLHICWPKTVMMQYGITEAFDSQRI